MSHQCHCQCPCGRRTVKYMMLLVISAVALIGTSTAYEATANMSKSQKQLIKRVGFIHITKTGGTSIEKSIYSKYLNSFGHKTTLANYTRVGDVAVCVLRDPIARFISIYNYYRYGSDVYGREAYWTAPVNSLNEFLSAWRNTSHPKHAVVNEAISVGRGFTWAAHFYPQIHWLQDIPLSILHAPKPKPRTFPQSVAYWLWGRTVTTDPRGGGLNSRSSHSARKNIIIIRHTSNRNHFARRVTEAFSYALREVNITKSQDDVDREKDRRAMPNINISKKLKNDTNTVDNISYDNFNWLKAKYRLDFELVDSAKSQFHRKSGPWKAVF